MGSRRFWGLLMVMVFTFFFLLFFSGLIFAKAKSCTKIFKHCFLLFLRWDTIFNFSASFSFFRVFRKAPSDLHDLFSVLGWIFWFMCDAVPAESNPCQKPDAYDLNGTVKIPCRISKYWLWPGVVRGQHGISHLQEVLRCKWAKAFEFPFWIN